MTVLWILLGVLAAIVLLLCLPLTLRLSWLPKTGAAGALPADR